jgi:hypothetical protein
MKQIIIELHRLWSVLGSQLAGMDLDEIESEEELYFEFN